MGSSALGAVVERFFLTPAELVETAAGVTVRALVGALPPLFLGDLLAGLGLGSQVVVALSAGFIVWYAFRALRIGRTVGGIVGQLVKYGMAVGTFAAVGIFFGWVNPGVLVGDLFAGAGAAAAAVGEFGDDLLDWLLGVV